jgi:hypothetical protein
LSYTYGVGIGTAMPFWVEAKQVWVGAGTILAGSIYLWHFVAEEEKLQKVAVDWSNDFRIVLDWST